MVNPVLYDDHFGKVFSNSFFVSGRFVNEMAI